MPMRKGLVAGGAGFLGTGLCGRLLEERPAVWGADNLLTGRRGSIEPLLCNPIFHFAERDIGGQACCPGHLDYGLHLASPGACVHDFGAGVSRGSAMGGEEGRG